MKTVMESGLKPQVTRVKKWGGLIVLAAMVLNAAAVLAVPTPKPPCGTSGPIGVTTPDPSSYSYTRTVPGSTTAAFTVSSPGVNINGSCDASLPYVYGNGNSGSDIDVAVEASAVDPVDPTPALTSAEETVMLNAFSFTPGFFILDDPGSGSQQVELTFTHTDQVPPGTYDVTISIDPENGVGVGSSSTAFTVTVQEPTVVDTLPPDVTINSPSAGSDICLNGTVGFEFTATDPPEEGAGTGITDVRASVASVLGAVSSDISSQLAVSPSLPVAADVTVTATADIPADAVGSFTIAAEADDGALHTGGAVAGYTVSVKVSSLPPMSVAGRQFKAGSTLPIKWTFTDCDGNLLPPFGSVHIVINDQYGPMEDRVAGEGAAFIRWELDEYGNALHYLTNFVIPMTGSYSIDVYVDDVDGYPAKQGELTFIAAGKGGKS